MPLPSLEERKRLEQQLRIKREALQTHLHKAQRTAKHERYTDVARSVRSLSDESFAELSIALSNASFGREADALREVEEALLRLHPRAYGYCVDCGQPITGECLRIDPASKRCLPCQHCQEYRHGGEDPTPRF